MKSALNINTSRGNNPIAIDLFCGVGGLSLGLSQSGFDVALKIEIEEISGRYAQYNSPESKVLYGGAKGDVRYFGRETIKSLSLRKDEVALITGGPPCQGFSLAGKQNVNDPLNELVLEFARVVNEIKPFAFLMENVPGITTAGSEKLRHAIRTLDKTFNICEPTKLNAWDFGVPQTRQRVFLLGIRKDFGTTPSMPAPTHLWVEKYSRALVPMTPNSWDAISDLPDVDDYDFLVSADRVPYDKQPFNDFQRAMRGIKGNFLNLVPPYKWDHSICTNCRLTQHGPDLLKRLAKLAHGQSDKTSGIRRINPMSLCSTIRAGTTKDRGSWSAPRPLHPFFDRVLTTRECARIQTFPDWFTFHPSKWHGNRMVGNAVPPLLASAIGSHILKLLGIDAKPTRSTLKRDDGLIRNDIQKAAESNYEGRKVSQKVFSWSPKKRRKRELQT